MLHGSTATPDGDHVLFGCADGILMVPMDPHTDEQDRLVAYPAGERVASFHHGSDGVIWGSTEGPLPALQRITTSRQAVLRRLP